MERRSLTEEEKRFLEAIKDPMKHKEVEEILGKAGLRKENART